MLVEHIEHAPEAFFTLSKRKGPRIFQAQDRAIDDFKKIDAREDQGT